MRYSSARMDFWVLDGRLVWLSGAAAWQRARPAPESGASRSPCGLLVPADKSYTGAGGPGFPTGDGGVSGAVGWRRCVAGRTAVRVYASPHDAAGGVSDGLTAARCGAGTGAWAGSSQAARSALPGASGGHAGQPEHRTPDGSCQPSGVLRSPHRPVVGRMSGRFGGQEGSTGGVPCVWKDSMVFRPQAWPFARSASVQVMVLQSGARTRRATGLQNSMRFPPGS